MVLHALDDLRYILRKTMMTSKECTITSILFLQVDVVKQKNEEIHPKIMNLTQIKNFSKLELAHFFGGTQIKSTPERSFENRLSPPHRLRGTIPQRSSRQGGAPQTWCLLAQVHLSRSSFDRWLRSAIHASQQLTCPIVSYLWLLCHRLVGYYWYIWSLQSESLIWLTNYNNISIKHSLIAWCFN